MAKLDKFGLKTREAMRNRSLPFKTKVSLTSEGHFIWLVSLEKLAAGLVDILILTGIGRLESLYLHFPGGVLF